MWAPTQASAQRVALMNLEFNLSQIPKGSELSRAEMVLATGDVNVVMSTVPAAATPEVRRIIRTLLQPWPEGRYTEAYNRSGGILNAFTPAWGEAQDEVWAGMLAGWKAETYPDEKARQAALRELEQRWNRTPHPFFAGLTPEQVMVGGGPREEALANEFLGLLSDQLDGQGFASEGEALVTTVALLRGWQVEPVLDRSSVLEVVRAERDELLARRARVMEDRAAQGR
jgi:hypothetical protein